MEKGGILRLELRVEGMMCSGCERTVRMALGGIDGVSEVEASHERGVVSWVAGEDSREAVRARLVAIGFPPVE